MKETTTFQQPFPRGGENPPANARYFTGRSYLAPLTRNGELDVPIYNVTFEPGCRNHWHSHSGGQVLLATAGRGFYMERGKPARALGPGDVVEIAPDVEHWHGAAPDSWFAHLAIACHPQDNQNRWLEPVDDEQYAVATGTVACSAPATDKAAPTACGAAATDASVPFYGYDPDMERTDPELMALVARFAGDEAGRYGSLDTRTRVLVVMAAHIARQAAGPFRRLIRTALDEGITPVEIRETLYHAVPYVGMSGVLDLLATANEVLQAAGARLPLEPQSTTTPDTRYERGLALQQSIFGEQTVDRMVAAAPADQRHVQRFLSSDCFGDYQIRTGLDTPMRELLTFALLVSMGGCDGQVKGHIAGNVQVGNDRARLLAVVTQLLPYIGYPRTLNALACLNEVLPDHR